jgi:hypothetical protein
VSLKRFIKQVESISPRANVADVVLLLGIELGNLAGVVASTVTAANLSEKETQESAGRA